jgi:hypothetical protein
LLVLLLLQMVLLMERLRALVGVGGNDGQGRCDLKLKVDAIERVHVVQLRLFVVGQVSVVVSHLVAEAHLVEGVMRVSERAGGCSAGGVGDGMKRELNRRTTHTRTHARGDGVVGERFGMDGE